MSFDAIGWIGSSLLGWSALPQLYTVHVNKHAKGMSWAFLMTWLIGECLCIIYVSAQPMIPVPLLTNYCVNLAMLLGIIWYKIVGGQQGT